MSDGGPGGIFEAGWYPSLDAAREIYWNGTGWTGGFRPATSSGGPGLGERPPIPAGWHPVAGGQQERFWDGSGWTEAFRSRGNDTQVTPAGVHGPAIASMVLGIASLLFLLPGLVGLPLGITSLKHCRPSGPKSGRGMAIAGIVCSSFSILVLLILVIAGTSGGGSR